MDSSKGSQRTIGSRHVGTDSIENVSKNSQSYIKERDLVIAMLCWASKAFGQLRSKKSGDLQ